MKDKISIQNVLAKGKVRIEEVAPDGTTRLIQEGENKVWINQLMADGLRAGMATIDMLMMGYNQLGLTTPYDGDPIVGASYDEDVQMLLGRIVGYGTVGSGTSGDRGGYRTVGSYITKQGVDGWESKMIFDFSPVQALGTIGCIGISNQANGTFRKPARGLSNSLYLNGSFTADGYIALQGTVAAFQIQKIGYDAVTLDLSGVATLPPLWVGTDAVTPGYDISTNALLMWNRTGGSLASFTFNGTVLTFGDTITCAIAPEDGPIYAFASNGDDMFFRNSGTTGCQKGHLADGVMSSIVNDLTDSSGYVYISMINDMVMFSTYGDSYPTSSILNIDSTKAGGGTVGTFVAYNAGWAYGTSIICVKTGSGESYEMLGNGVPYGNNLPLTMYEVVDYTRTDGYGLTVTYTLTVSYSPLT